MMKTLREALSHFEVRRIFRALLYTLLLSFFYNVGYLLSLTDAMNYLAAYALQIGLSLLASIGQYFICTIAWGRKHGTLTLTGILLILGLQALYIFVVQGVLSTLYLRFYSYGWVQIILALVAAAGIILMIPFQLVWDYGIYTGIDSFQELWHFCLNTFRKHYRSLLNWFCVLILVIVLLDSLWWGVFSLSNGFNAVDVLSRMLFMGNPMMSWMLYLYLLIGQGWTLSGIWLPVFVCFVLGVLYAILELNYVLLVQRKAEDGTAVSETHKAKA